ncbi:hypothetical protein HMPREF9018_0988 [Prevotella amnii CRIS 21A-A]|jgi:hypothetical protein|uniref:Uncharacterized protein n=1 Tax=Prevotella amnii CRIS 21A-A TaxID=679191 RepID=E1GWE6_9BACT|nr:DUF5715 family protein [Prevotella amnii]EFN91029.1 hypothetical protein HMPREF9018_0988 [Prevotella amnii CRIS 21A-A]
MKKKSAKIKTCVIISFTCFFLGLVLIRLIFPSLSKKHYSKSNNTYYNNGISVSANIGHQNPPFFLKADGSLIRHHIIGVPDYDTSFPDMNNVQLPSAKKKGVKPVENRSEAEHRKRELVFIGYNPYYEVKKLYNSIPYLVPDAAILLQDIGRSFMDSLQIKNIPINKILVTSVLRTKEDVIKLRSFNRNASENSCHQYGTTFDIAYNKYYAITRSVRDDTLKWVLAEVLNNLRSKNRCYVKHERHQGCFHITVR